MERKEDNMGKGDSQFVNQSTRLGSIYLLAHRKRICLNFDLTQSPEDRRRHQDLTHFISQQRVGGSLLV